MQSCEAYSRAVWAKAEWPQLHIRLLCDVNKGERTRFALPFFLPYLCPSYLSIYSIFSFFPSSSLFPRELVSPQGMSHNVPRVPEVGDHREPIWAKRSGAGYPLLCVVPDTY